MKKSFVFALSAAAFLAMQSNSQAADNSLSDLLVAESHEDDPNNPNNSIQDCVQDYLVHVNRAQQQFQIDLRRSQTNSNVSFIDAVNILISNIIQAINALIFCINNVT